MKKQSAYSSFLSTKTRYNRGENRNSVAKVAKLLHLSIKKKQVSFVLRSIFRNFARD